MVARGWSGQKRQDLPARLTDKNMYSPRERQPERERERETEGKCKGGGFPRVRMRQRDWWSAASVRVRHPCRPAGVELSMRLRTG